MNPVSHEEGLLSARFVARTLFVFAVASAVILSARLASLYLLVFGAVVVAVVLRSIADPLARIRWLRGRLGVFAALALVIGAISATGYLFGRQLYQQATQLGERLPSAVALIQDRLSGTPQGAWLLTHLRGVGDQVERVFALAPKIALGLGSSLTTLLLVVVAGVFLAGDPVGAREGLLSFAPKAARPRLRQVLDACGAALKGWFRAQLISMALVGALVGAGLWVIGMPDPLVLGLVAGLAQFVPVVGPIAAAAPALVLASTAGAAPTLETLLLFVVVSQLEANFITPMVQKSVASLPVVFGIFAIVGFGDLLGPLGVLFAVPLALTLYTIATMLYREDVLGDTPDSPEV